MTCWCAVKQKNLRFLPAFSFFLFYLHFMISFLFFLSFFFSFFNIFFSFLCLSVCCLCGFFLDFFQPFFFVHFSFLFLLLPVYFVSIVAFTFFLCFFASSYSLSVRLFISYLRFLFRRKQSWNIHLFSTHKVIHVRL